MMAIKNTPPQSAQQILKSLFGFDNFRGHQAAIIDALINGNNALALMSTGAGKSLCYQIPSLLRPGVGIVISPLIALMQNQVSALKHIGIKAEFINSSQNFNTVKQVENALKNGELDLLYVAPERLLMPSFLSMIQELPIALFAIDEAHCVSQWGHDFRTEYLQLKILSEQFPHVPRIALTATADQMTRNEIVKQLNLEDAHVFVSGFDRPNIRYHIQEKNNAKKQLLSFIKTHHKNDAGIIYCLSRKNVDETAQWLCSQGIEALAYHAGLSAEERTRRQEQFLYKEGVIMVATIAFGMGIDKPNVRFVAHLDLPKSMEAYYQETGRAGRDGLYANAWLSYGIQDAIIHRQMIEDSNASATVKRVEQRKLDALLGLCETTSCRRQALLHYFGEEFAGACMNCDNCLDQQEQYDATETVQLALSCIYRTEQRFGIGHLIDVLIGKETDKVINFGHHRLGLFGRGKAIKQVAWRSIFRQLIAMRFVRVEMEAYGALKLTASCGPVFKGGQRVFLRKLSEKTTEPKKKAEKPKILEGHQDLYHALKEVRLKLAQTYGVPPYVIFHDRTLLEMAQQCPRGMDDLRKLYGVGEQKLNKYGASFLTAVREFGSSEQQKAL